MDIKKLRTDLIKLSNSIVTESRELSLAKTNCQSAFMWCGQHIKFSEGTESPYKNNGKRTSIKDIEPMFEGTEDTLLLSGNIVKDIDGMREFLEKRILLLTDYLSEPKTEDEGVAVILSAMNIYIHMTETKMWLGMELGRLRDTQ